MLSRLSSSQMNEWVAEFTLQAEEAEERAVEARNQARLKGRMRR